MVTASAAGFTNTAVSMATAIGAILSGAFGFTSGSVEAWDAVFNSTFGSYRIRLTIRTPAICCACAVRTRVDTLTLTRRCVIVQLTSRHTRPSCWIAFAIPSAVSAATGCTGATIKAISAAGCARIAEVFAKSIPASLAAEILASSAVIRRFAS